MWFLEIFFLYTNTFFSYAHKYCSRTDMKCCAFVIVGFGQKNLLNTVIRQLKAMAVCS